MADELLKNVLDAERQGRVTLEAAEQECLARMVEANRRRESRLSAERGRLRDSLERETSLARERAEAAHAALLSAFAAELDARPLDHEAFDLAFARALGEIRESGAASGPERAIRREDR